MLACQFPIQAAGEQVPSCIYEKTSQDGLVVQMGLLVNLEKGHCDFSDQDEWGFWASISNPTQHPKVINIKDSGPPIFFEITLLNVVIGSTIDDLLFIDNIQTHILDPGDSLQFKVPWSQFQSRRGLPLGEFEVRAKWRLMLNEEQVNTFVIQSVKPSQKNENKS